MFYTVYKITNLVNNKIYIGAHKTVDLDDGYMGSGKVLKRAQEKYGMENFEKEILEVFENSEEMFEMEAKLVTIDFVKRSDTYNLKEGGFGGFDYINSTAKNVYGNNGKIGYGGENLLAGDIIKTKLIEAGLWDIRNERISNSLKQYISINGNSFSGRSHTSETKKQIGKNSSIHQTGELNSQFGSQWITNGKESKKIKKTDFIPEGWYKGRKMNTDTSDNQT